MSSNFYLAGSPPNESIHSSKKTVFACSVLTFLLFITCVVLVVVLLLGLHCPKKAEIVSTIKPKRSLDGSVKFLWLTDPHLDTFYDDMVSAKATLCRKLGSYKNASYKAHFGRVGCDSPSVLIDSLLASASGKASDAHFGIITGDLSAHDVDEPYFQNGTKPSDRTLNNIFIMVKKIRESLTKIPIFPMLGNNDLPGHYTLPVNDDWYNKTLASFAPLILCDGCPDSAPKPTDMETLKKTFLDGGYYGVNLPNTDNRLRLLVLNSLYWNIKASKKHQGPAFHDIANRQMTWLENQLEQAKKNGQKVFLTSHISPGIDPYNGAVLWAANYTKIYVDIVAGRYSDVVAGQLYGHIHKEDFHLQVIDTQTPAFVPSDTPSPTKKSFVLFLAPISPIYGSNPAYGVGYIDTERQALLDYDRHFMDIVMATKFNTAKWELAYRFSDRYPSSNPYIDAERIYQLNQELINTSNTKIWSSYVMARTIFYQPGSYSRFALYCAMRYVFDADYQKCIEKFNVPGG